MSKVLTPEQREALPYKIGVHVSHCCAQHGCKYGEDDCPVVRSEYDQDYACEACLPVEVLERQIASIQREIAWSNSLTARGVKIADFKYDFDWATFDGDES